jgi:hypothetical protein
MFEYLDVRMNTPTDFVHPYAQVFRYFSGPEISLMPALSRRPHFAAGEQPSPIAIPGAREWQVQAVCFRLVRVSDAV